MKRTALAFLAAAFVAFAAPAIADKSAGNVVDDNTINASVKAALAGTKDLGDSADRRRDLQGSGAAGRFPAVAGAEGQGGSVAKGVSNVKSVHNAIAVQPENTVGSKLDDTMTTSKVKTALMEDKT